MPSQLLEDGRDKIHPYNQLMVEKVETFASRFERLRGDRSYQALSHAIFAKTEIRITPQAMHKWVATDGGITPENLKIVAGFFGVTRGWLLFGEGPGPDQKPDLTELLRALPENHPQQIIDFIEYKFERAENLIASDRLSDYMKMLESIRTDLKR